MVAKSLKNPFFLIFMWRESRFSLIVLKHVKLKRIFFLPQMEKFTLNAHSMFHSEAFQFIIAEKLRNEVSLSSALIIDLEIRHN